MSSQFLGSGGYSVLCNPVGTPKRQARLQENYPVAYKLRTEDIFVCFPHVHLWTKLSKRLAALGVFMFWTMRGEMETRVLFKISHFGRGIEHQNIQAFPRPNCRRAGMWEGLSQITVWEELNVKEKNEGQQTKGIQNMQLSISRNWES